MHSHPASLHHTRYIERELLALLIPSFFTSILGPLSPFTFIIRLCYRLVSSTFACDYCNTHFYALAWYFSFSSFHVTAPSPDGNAIWLRHSTWHIELVKTISWTLFNDFKSQSYSHVSLLFALMRLCNCSWTVCRLKVRYLQSQPVFCYIALQAIGNYVPSIRSYIFFHQNFVRKQEVVHCADKGKALGRGLPISPMKHICMRFHLEWTADSLRIFLTKSISLELKRLEIFFSIIYVITLGLLHSSNFIPKHRCEGVW